MDTLNSSVSSARKLKKFSIFNCQSSKRGFTLLEVVIATGILVILSGIMLGYSQGSKKIIELASNESKLLGLLFTAKGLSQSFVLDPPTDSQICAYGVRVDADSEPQKAFIFQDLVARPMGDAADYCSTSYDGKNIYNSGEELPDAIYTFHLSDSLEYGDAATDLLNVVFIPPDPTTILNGAPTDPDNPDAGTKFASIIVQTKEDTDTRFEIGINYLGQISTE